MTNFNPAQANFDIVIFDLDGTLIDSRVGIHSSIVNTLRAMNAPTVDQTLLAQFIGPPLIDSFMRLCGMSEEEAKRAVDIYKGYFAADGIEGFDIYDGIKEMLWLLRASGVTMAIATTKDDVFAHEIALKADLLPFFRAVIGSDPEGTMVRKPELIAAALSALGVSVPINWNAGEDATAPRIVMVGDHALDIIGAKTNGIASVAVTYGFGAEQELLEAEPDDTADSVAALRRCLLGA